MDFKNTFSGFSVDDIQKAKDFYVGTLGLNLLNQEMGLDLELPGGARHFIYEKPDHQPATFTVLNFVVTDIEAAVATLKEKGVTFESYTGSMIETDDKNIARGKATGEGPDIAWFKDPAGNVLAVLED